MGNLFGTFVGAAQDPHGAEVALLCFSNIGRFAMWRFFTLFRTVSILGPHGGVGGGVGWLVRPENTQSHAAQPSRFLTKWSFRVWSGARTKFFTVTASSIVILRGDFLSPSRYTEISRGTRDLFLYLSSILELQPTCTDGEAWVQVFKSSNVIFFFSSYLGFC
jgi:hypothetical protein